MSTSTIDRPAPLAIYSEGGDDRDHAVRWRLSARCRRERRRDHAAGDTLEVTSSDPEHRATGPINGAQRSRFAATRITIHGGGRGLRLALQIRMIDDCD